MLKNIATGDMETVAGSALFVFLGALPRTDWLGDRIARDDRGFILTGPDVGAPERRLGWNVERHPYLLETSIPGVFAAGNVRHGSGKRVSTAVGEGAMAVMSIWQYRAQVGL
ncbi:MAG: NAD(P)/FAD-dependent oxidoreductase [Thermomicrobiales bacterium]